MAETYMFIDESGNLGDDGTKYFIIAALWTQTPEMLRRLIKNIRRNKFRKQLKKAQELKANSSSREVREGVLQKMSQLDDLRCHAIILEKARISSTYLKNNKNKLYNYVCGILAEAVGVDSKKLVVRIDKSKGKQTLRDDFNEYFKRKWRQRFWNGEVEFYHSWSHMWAGLQLADFIAWAVFQKFEYGNDFYTKLIERKLNITHVWE